MKGFADIRCTQEPGSLWIHSVPQEIADSTPDKEKRRQEALNEIFYTERDFVRDLEYLRDVRCFAGTWQRRQCAVD